VARTCFGWVGGFFHEIVVCGSRCFRPTETVVEKDPVPEPQPAAKKHKANPNGAQVEAVDPSAEEGDEDDLLAHSVFGSVVATSSKPSVVSAAADKVTAKKGESKLPKTVAGRAQPLAVQVSAPVSTAASGKPKSSAATTKSPKAMDAVGVVPPVPPRRDSDADMDDARVLARAAVDADGSTAPAEAKDEQKTKSPATATATATTTATTTTTATAKAKSKSISTHEAQLDESDSWYVCDVI
jgi:hypothetical protein